VTPRPHTTARTAVALALLLRLLPHAEREVVVRELADEHAERAKRDGTVAADRWLRRQVLASAPALLRRGWWRGWTGFEPRANRLQPGGLPMEGWIMDLRFAARRLRSRPTYAIVAVLTLALGVGGTSAVYSIVRGPLWEPLPYERADDVVQFWGVYDWSEAEFLMLRPDLRGFQAVSAYRPEDVIIEQDGAPARLATGIASSAELFDVLGTRPMLGRGFRAGDDVAGAEPVAILSHGLWRELGADASIIGQRVRVDGIERSVVGVMPRGFWFPDPSVRVWITAELNPENGSGRYALVGRMPPGQSLEAMAPALTRITTALAERFTYPEQWDKTKNAQLTPVREAFVGPLRPALLATLAVMGLILIIAAANVTALMLGQIDGRATELAVRSALGADRRRIVRQITIEALLLGVLSGAAGAVLAAAGFRAIVGAIPLGAWAERAAVDWQLLAVAIVVAIAAALAIAFATAFSVWRGDLRDALVRARTSGIGGRGGRLENGLVVAQVAVAMLIAAGAALLSRSVGNLYAVDPGVEVAGVAVLDVAFGGSMPRAERSRIMAVLVREFGELPGVRSAAVTQKLPLRGSSDNWGITVIGRPDVQGSTTSFRMVSHDYFATMGIEVRSGRVFEQSDREGGPLVVVVNQALADKYFPGEDPVGRELDTGFGSPERIIGVVDNVAEAALTDEPAPARYMLASQLPISRDARTFVMRLDRPGDAAATLEAARRRAQESAGIAIQEATTMQRVFDRAVGPVRQVLMLFAILTAVALVLGAVGVYGVISHFVWRRQRDWGIRIALGLAPARVMSAVVGRGAWLIAGGVTLGVLAAIALARLFESFLYDVGAADPLALSAAAGALMLVGLVAAAIPAWRAGRTDPLVVLRDA
jgi:predicted permease